MGHAQRKRKPCSECGKEFTPTGANCKRCPPCRRKYDLEYHRKRWHTNYQKKGRNQKGNNNNAWKGGSSPGYYRTLALKYYGNRCLRCGADAVLVHHKDGNRKNSNLENLEVLCKRCHQLDHHCAENLPEKVEFKPKSCAVCNSRFQPSGPRSKYCSNCGGKGAKV
jgi:hypothetical protein